MSGNMIRSDMGGTGRRCLQQPAAHSPRIPVKIGFIPADDRAAAPRPASRSTRRSGSTMQQNGTTVAGKKVEVILKDDARRCPTTPSARRRS